MVAPIYHVGQAAGHVFNVWSVSPAPDAMVTVRRGGSDAESGESLAAAYAAAKTLKPGGNALSATNRACVMIPPGRYNLPPLTNLPSLTLDAEYVDLIGMADTPAGTWVTAFGNNGETSPTVLQTADDVHLMGFTVHQRNNQAGNHNYVIDAANAASVYRFMHFRNAQPSKYSMSVHAVEDLAGLWEFCEGDNWSWRLAGEYELSATMRDCVAGDYSFGTDANPGASITGTFQRCVGGDRSFGGCVTDGCDIAAGAVFEDCKGGDRCWALGMEFAGTARRCIGGDGCFGGYAGTDTHYGSVAASAVLEACVAGAYSFGGGPLGLFSGYAKNCEAGSGSFGGWQGAGTSCSGILIDCRTIDRAKPLNVEGAYIRGCDIECVGAGESAIKVLTRSQIYDSVLEVVNGGVDTITADAAVELVIHACRYNGAGIAGIITVVGGDNLNTGFVQIP